jgi:hypothetical protein
MADGAVFSSNGEYWFNTDGLQEGKQIIVISSDDNQHQLTLNNPYPNFPAKISWVNEKIVFIRVYLGRTHGVDMLFDSESGKFIYRESLIDGTLLFRQTKQALEK